MTVVREGEPAPDFTLTSDAGRQVTSQTFAVGPWFSISTRGTWLRWFRSAWPS